MTTQGQYENQLLLLRPTSLRLVGGVRDRADPLDLCLETILAETPPPGLTPIFMGEGGTKGDHRVITPINSKESEALH